MFGETCLYMKYVVLQGFFFQIESIASKTLFFLLQAISLSGSQIQISDSAGSCEAGQTATVKASDGSGLLTLTSTGE